MCKSFALLSRQITTSFCIIRAECSFCCPTNSIKALKATTTTTTTHLLALYTQHNSDELAAENIQSFTCYPCGWVWYSHEAPQMQNIQRLQASVSLSSDAFLHCCTHFNVTLRNVWQLLSSCAPLSNHNICIGQVIWQLTVDLGPAQSRIFGSARNFFGSLSRLEPKIMAQQQSCTQKLMHAPTGQHRMLYY